MHGSNTGVSCQDWLKAILLSHEVINSHGHLPPVEEEVFNWIGRLFNLNPTQVIAFRRAISIDGSRLSICQGPPGTGKTHLIVAVICFFLAQHKRFLFSAGINKANEVVVKTLLPALMRAELPPSGLYWVRQETFEKFIHQPDLEEILDELRDPRIMNVSSRFGCPTCHSLEHKLKHRNVHDDHTKCSLASDLRG